MLSLRLPFLLYTFLWVSVTCLIQGTYSTSGGSVNPITAPQPSDADDLGKHATLMEELLRIDKGQLRPVYQVVEAQHPAAGNHIYNPHSRFIKLYHSEGSRTYIMATPWNARQPDGSHKNGVLFFNIDEHGDVIPTIHTGMGDDVGDQIWNQIKERATMTQQKLFSELIKA